MKENLNIAFLKDMVHLSILMEIYIKFILKMDFEEEYGIIFFSGASLKKIMTIILEKDLRYYIMVIIK